MSENVISKEDIKKLGLLSNLEVSSKETDKLADLLSDTLDYVKTLNELDTSKTAETFQVTGLQNVFQSRETGKIENTTTLVKDKALSNAKETSNGLISTKAVFDR